MHTLDNGTMVAKKRSGVYSLQSSIIEKLFFCFWFTDQNNHMHTKEGLQYNTFKIRKIAVGFGHCSIELTALQQLLQFFIAVLQIWQK